MGQILFKVFFLFFFRSIYEVIDRYFAADDPSGLPAFGPKHVADTGISGLVNNNSALYQYDTQ